MRSETRSALARRPGAAGRASGFERGQASVELVICLPIFIVLIAFIGYFYSAYQSRIALTTVANDCAQVGSMNFNQDWRDAQAQAAVNAGRAGYGITQANYEGPTRIEMGVDSIRDITVYCQLAIVSPNGFIRTDPTRVDRSNPANLIREIAWPLQVYRSCYKPGMPAMYVGEAIAPGNEDVTQRLCDNN
jgi:hypothetical protein